MKNQRSRAARYADKDRWSPVYVLARQCVDQMRGTKHGPRAVDIVAEHIQIAMDEAAAALKAAK